MGKKGEGFMCQRDGTWEVFICLREGKWDVKREGFMC